MCKEDLNMKDLWAQMHQLTSQASVPQANMQTCTHTCALMGLVHHAHVHVNTYSIYLYTWKSSHIHRQTHTHFLVLREASGVTGRYPWPVLPQQPTLVWTCLDRTLLSRPCWDHSLRLHPSLCSPCCRPYSGIGKEVSACHLTVLSAACHQLDKYLVTIHRVFLWREASHITPAPQVSKLKSLFCTWPLWSPEGVRAFALWSSTLWSSILWTPWETDYFIHS